MEIDVLRRHSRKDHVVWSLYRCTYWSRKPKVSHRRIGEWPRSLALDFYTNIRCELASPANGQIPSNTCTRKGNGELGKQKCSVLVAEF